jgi:N6-L-threonylcarbamoyladenine synthase
LFKKLEKSLKNLKIDLIAVTAGPGLEPCLWVGVNFAKDLAKKLEILLIPINHIEAHIFANFAGSKAKKLSKKDFPAICLVVSGGHTQLILVKDFGKYKILGETRDDAAGECFDKTARILGLGYPGGPAIEAEAAKFQVLNSNFQIRLPRPMIYQKNYDFSFSGLKTAVLYDFKSRSSKIKKSIRSTDSGLTLSGTEVSKKYLQAMAKEIQQSVIDVLIRKTIKATKDYKAKTIILGGGVSANKELRKQFKAKIKKELPKVKYEVPDKKLSTDNALMIAITAYYHQLKGIKKYPKIITVDANLRIG